MRRALVARGSRLRAVIAAELAAIERVSALREYMRHRTLAAVVTVGIGAAQLAANVLSAWIEQRANWV